MHSVSLAGNSSSQVLTVKSRVMEDLKTKMSYKVESQSVSMDLILNGQRQDGTKTTTTASLSTSLRNPSRPKLQIGAKLAF